MQRGRIALSAFLLVVSIGCGGNMPEAAFDRFLEEHVSRVAPLVEEANRAYWRASLTGKPEDFERYSDLTLEIQKIYSDRADFKKISRWREDGAIRDPLKRRQLDLLYLAYLRNQIDPKLNERITKLSSEIENRFNVFRGKIDGREVTLNDIQEILRKSTDSELRRKAWEASKAVGSEVAADVVRLAKLRNEAARQLGFDNYYAMALALSEQDEEELVRLFDELDELTREPFAAMKAEVDRLLADRYGLSPEELRPWHYEDPFFQEAPQVYQVDLDRYFEDKDVVELVAAFYEGIGLKAQEVISRSDLFEKPGKLPHAYCIDIDRKGDVRVLANVKNDEAWASTMLHELGHAVYSVNIDRDLPYLLREEAHAFTTEAVAMFFGRLTKNPAWLEKIAGVPHEEARRITPMLEKSQRLAQLVFARWCQVMFRFERALYQNPDQDLNRLWWRLVERYQLVAAPPGRNAPDWASKIHVVSYPVYYHNYMLGELLASQIDHAIRSNVLRGEDPEGFAGRPEVGRFLKERLFRAGKRYPASELVEKATGERLTARYFAEQFVATR
jgi:peptidyl-dipeptidase A